MTSTIKRRPRGYRTGISSEVFEFVMKLLRDTLGTTGRYLDLMRINAPLRIQGPGYRGNREEIWSPIGKDVTGWRQFYRYDDRRRSEVRAPFPVVWPGSQTTFRMVGSQTLGASGRAPGQWAFRFIEKYFHDRDVVGPSMRRKSSQGSFVPFRHTYNASRII